MKLKPGTVLSVFSFSVSLFMLGFYIIVLFHISKLVSIVNERTPVIIELNDDLSEKYINHLIDSLESNKDVYELEYISKEQGLSLLEKDLGSELISSSADNPLKNIIKFKLKNNVFKENRIEEFINKIKEINGVATCYYEKTSVDSLKKNLKALNSFFFILGIIFIIISFVLIYNNLKFILSADRYNIKTMELIGASPSFIKRPYIKLSMKIGFYSGLIAIFFLLVLIMFLNLKFDLFNTILDIRIIVSVFVGIFVFSTILPPVFVNYLTIKYLKA
ncbi:MAG TPA: FtsX-like permease family protein [Bacteroidetes bacterium]|nr:FtsX-like permease family protein [Bacteroidota bacterium]